MAVRLDHFITSQYLRFCIAFGVDLYSVVEDHKVFSGGHSGGETPLPFPNRVVKPSCADGTAGVAQWESRTLPDFLSRPTPSGVGLFSCIRK